MTIFLFIVFILLASCCLHNHFKHRTLSADAKIDFLTKVFNRKILPEIEELDKNNKFYVLACDIDFFKHVNDTYGHAVGDIVLKTVADAIKGTFKSNIDFVVRFGGEEFFVFMKANDIDENILLERAENLRIKIENLNILTHDMRIVKVTSSFGISTNTSIPLKERIEQADKNLYKSKTSGRNKVTI